MGLAFVWRKQQDCNLREMTKLVEDRFKDTEGQNILRVISEKITSTLHRAIRF
jgi:hypothetical protein